MAITIDTTVGGASANSYNTVAEATTYFEAEPVFTVTWAAFSTERQKQELVLSARAIDALPLLGQRIAPTVQALAFPRSTQNWALDWPPSVIPVPVQHAQLEIIKYRSNAADSTTGQVSRDVNSFTLTDVFSVDFGLLVDSEVNLIMGGNWERVQALMARWMAPTNAWALAR